jgi:hypothetical protein
VNARPAEVVELARLLRRLDDAVSLRNSALLHDVFTELEGGESSRTTESIALLRARAAILSAVATLNAEATGPNVHFARQRAIVTRCDLRGEKHATVARDLGISLREFYRERRRALERLLLLIRSNLAPQAPVRSLPTRFELDMDHVANLRLVGDFKAVFTQLEQIAREACTPEQGIRALCYGVEIAADIGDDERARRFFERALTCTSEITTDPSPAELDIQMASAYVGWQGTDVERSSQSLERAASAVEQLPPAADRHEIRAAVGVLFRCAEIACLHGDVSKALTVLGQARKLLDRTRHKPARMLGQLFLELSVVQAMVNGGMSRSGEYALEALAIFEAAQDPSGVAGTTAILCSHLTSCGDFSGARHFGKTALQLALASGNAAEIADKALILSLAESFGGNARQGLALARKACAAVHGGLFEVRGPIAVAEAYLRLGWAAEALEVAERVGRYASARGMLRYVGTASRLAADAHSALGNRAAARDEADNAVVALEAHGHPHSLCRAYETASRLGVGSRTARLAAELRATLTRGIDAPPLSLRS